MEYKDSLRLELRENKKEIFVKIIEGIKDSFEKNETVRKISDIIVLNEKMTLNLEKKDWADILEKARIYFEMIEDYDMCKTCRDLMKQINPTP